MDSAISQTGSNSVTPGFVSSISSALQSSVRRRSPCLTPWREKSGCSRTSSARSAGNGQESPTAVRELILSCTVLPQCPASWQRSRTLNPSALIRSSCRNCLMAFVFSASHLLDDQSAHFAKTDSRSAKSRTAVECTPRLRQINSGMGVREFLKHAINRKCMPRLLTHRYYVCFKTVRLISESGEAMGPAAGMTLSLPISLGAARLTQFPALSIRRSLIACSSHPTSISGTEDSRRSVYASNGGVSTCVFEP